MTENPNAEHRCSKIPQCRSFLTLLWTKSIIGTATYEPKSCSSIPLGLVVVVRPKDYKVCFKCTGRRQIVHAGGWKIIFWERIEEVLLIKGTSLYEKFKVCIVMMVITEIMIEKQSNEKKLAVGLLLDRNSWKVTG